MAPIASAVRRRGSARRAPAVAVLVLVTLFVLLGAVPGVSAAHAEPPHHRSWLYEFADFTATPAATDYDHRAVTLTGVLLRHDHLGGPDVPAAGETVDLLQSAAGQRSGGGTPSTGDPAQDGGAPSGGVAMGTVTTDAQGRFWLQNAPVDQRADQGGTAAPGPYTVAILAVHHTADDPAAGPGDADDTGDNEVEARVDVTATPSTARLTVDYRLGPVSAAGRTVTAQGAYQRDTAQGPRPLAGATVRLEYHPLHGRPVVKEGATGTDGRFSIAFTASSDGMVSAAVDGTPDPYLDPAGTGGDSRPIAVPQPTPSATPSPTATAPRLAAPVVHRVTATPARTHSPAPRPSSPAAAPKAVQPADTPNRLAATGDGTPRAAFMTGGITLLAAGLVLMVARRRMRSAD